MFSLMCSRRSWFLVRCSRKRSFIRTCPTRRRSSPRIAKGLVKQGKHEALADIYESIEELKYYREHFLKI
jgi:oligoribonuclease (3'-5' exoribonuclease)